MIAISSQPAADWDAFVESRPEASLYHRVGWSLLIRETFGHPVCFIEARRQDGNLEGVLPLIRQKSLLFGTFATSMPFFNYGGALAESESVAAGLMQRAVQVAQEWGCSYVEFRDERPKMGAWQVRTDKVTMILSLPVSFEQLSRQLGAKLRSQVKRAERERATVRVGGIELLESFYDVFCRNMRDLGTPVYPRQFFGAILRRFRDQCQIVCVDRDGRPAAAAFLLFDKLGAEIPWASCLDDAKPLGFNMKLYWEVLSAVHARGCVRLDFGRSTIDSGPYRFKKQWGAVPVQLHWHRWEKNVAVASTGDRNGGLMGRAIAVWQKLPLPIANALGPVISPSLPW